MITCASEFFSVKRRAKRLVNRQLSHLLYRPYHTRPVMQIRSFFISEKCIVQTRSSYRAVLLSISMGLSKKERTERAKKAAAARWEKK